MAIHMDIVETNLIKVRRQDMSAREKQAENEAPIIVQKIALPPFPSNQDDEEEEEDLFAA